MVLPSVEVNYLAILVATIISYIVGALWYSPLLFGKTWMKEQGFTAKDIEKAKKKGMGKLYFFGFIGTLVTAYVLVHFIGFLDLTTFTEALQLGFWTWLGFFAATTLLGSMLWEGKSFKLFLINGAYWLISLWILSSILTAWR